MHSKSFFNQISINRQIHRFQKHTALFHQLPDDRSALTKVHRRRYKVMSPPSGTSFMPAPVEHQAKTAARFRFGLFEADSESGELWKSGIRIRLQAQPFRVLICLLERPGEVITREEIQQRLWGNDTIVDFDHSLGTAINKLREALGDSAENPRFIETLARRGYRFIAPVTATGHRHADPFLHPIEHGTGPREILEPHHAPSPPPAPAPRLSRFHQIAIA